MLTELAPSRSRRSCYRGTGGGSRGKVKVVSALVIVRDGQREIDRRQKEKDIRLYDRHAKVQPQKDSGMPTGTSEKKASVTRSPANMFA